MRALPVGLLAVIPWLPPVNDPPPPVLPCLVAVEISVHVPLGRRHIDWRLVTAEVEHVWAPYGVTFCWIQDGAGCEGVAVRLRVLVTDTLGVSNGLDGGHRTLGEIQFDRTGPGHLILLSIDAALHLIERAQIGDRSLDTWSDAAVDAHLPRVLGRALAHEIGHFLLGSRLHTRTGLMAGGFRPDLVTSGQVTRFGLSPPAAARVRGRCEPREAETRLAQAGALPARTGP